MTIALDTRTTTATRIHDQIGSVVSHELRTPVTCILGLARTLTIQEARLAPEQRAHLTERIVAHAEHMAALVEDLLAAAQIDRGIDQGPTDVGLAIGAAIAVVDGATRAAGRVRVSTIVELEADLVATVRRDALVHALSHLVANAWKFSPPGCGVRIRARADSDRIVIDVVNAFDDGPALSEEVFEPFVQLDSSDRRVVGGLGLGLAVVKRLIEASGGSVEVDGSDGIATFRVTVPR